MKRFSLRRVASASAVVAALIVVGPFAAVRPIERADAAVANQYSAPEWFPLRGDWVIGCTWKNGCAGGYHGYPAMDIARDRNGTVGGDPVYAAGAGLATVFSTGNTCGSQGTKGNEVQVDHGGGVKSYYAHLSAPAISGPTWVDANSVIGYVGQTGWVEPCTFKHLHFEIRVNGTSTNPGELKACIGNRLTTYPAELGKSSWSDVPLWSSVHSDGTSCLTPIWPVNSTIPDGTRFTEQGSLQQYLSMYGASLPIGYGDAVAYDSDGNHSSATVAAGYVNAHPAANFPANRVVRPVGQNQQYLYDGGQLRPIDAPGTSDCLRYTYGQATVAVVPSMWSSTKPVGPGVPCSLPDGTRFTEQGSLQQYLSMYGASLPIGYGDAVAYDSDGNHLSATVAAGYVNAHSASKFPANRVVRPVGQNQQYLYDGGQLRPIDTPATSDCLRYINSQAAIAVVPSMWSSTKPLASVAACVVYTTNWSGSENARVMKSAAYENMTPEQLQKFGIQVIEYLLAASNPRPAPKPLNPPPSSAGPIGYGTLWTTSDIALLRDVQAQYSLTPQQAQKYGVQVVNYLLASGGH